MTKQKGKLHVKKNEKQKRTAEEGQGGHKRAREGIKGEKKGPSKIRQGIWQVKGS